MSEPPAHSRDDAAVVRFLSFWMRISLRRPGATVALTLLATLGLGLYAFTHIRFNVDPNALFSPDLRFQQMIREFSRHFPVLTDSILIVVDGQTPEATREAQVSLAAALTTRTDHFHRVYLPGEEPFFERTGLLYGSVEELEEFADNMALFQPVLGELSQEPSLPTLARVIRLGLEEIDASGAHDDRWEMVLDHFRSATVAAFDEFPVAVSWESILLADSGFDPSPMRVIVAEPILDRERVLASADAIGAIHAAVDELGLGPEKGMRIRVSGYPALNHEEMIGLAVDTGLAGGLSFILVVAVLTVAFRSLRLVAAAAVTLLAGLVWAAAFAGATVVQLNPHSITFGVLVIGLGVDFIIHLGMHFVVHVREGESAQAALLDAVRDTGPALVLCAATTAVGFLAFAPTAYRGVSDLGLVASGGMVAILFLTLTLLPSLIVLLLPTKPLDRLAKKHRAHVLRFRPPPPWVVCGVAVVLGVVAVPMLSQVDLDTNVIRMRNPESVSVQAFEDLLLSRDASPWYLDALTPSLEEARRLAALMAAVDGVDRTVTLADFVPDDQEEKLEILADVAMFMDLGEVAPRPQLSRADQIDALLTLRDFLANSEVATSGSPLARSADRLRQALDQFVERAAVDDDAALRELEAILLDPLPEQIERLRANLAVEAIAFEDLPDGLTSRMLAANGQARIQVYPAEDLGDHDAMVGFVESIRPIWGDITGLPVNLVESARASWASLREALLWSALAITVLLLVLWRRMGDTLIALSPLLLAVVLTQASTVLLPISLNFVNVIVLPLLLGIGIDSGVHLVHRAARLPAGAANLLATTTARAVLFSAVTTVASFGTLAISSHRGVASLGWLLVVGMLWTLAANLLLLPALLTLRARWRSSRGSRAA